MAPLTSPALQPPLAPPAPSSDALDQLRALAGPGHATDELVESVRRQMRREYERGYVDGSRVRQAAPPKNETTFQRYKRRLGRRGRHAARDWMLSTRQLRKAVFNFVLVVVLSAVGIAVSLRLGSGHGGDKKFDIGAFSKKK